MASRLSFDTITTLRRTLQQIENERDPRFDASALAELKRLVIQRIAVLEAKAALEDLGGAAPAPAAEPKGKRQPKKDVAA